MLGKLSLAVFSLSLFSSCENKGNGSIGVDLKIAGKEYCREISFPQGWHYPLRDTNGLDYPTPFKEYEFREGDAPDEFLVSGSFEARYSPMYTTTKYRLNLSNPSPSVTAINNVIWEDAASKVVPVFRKSVFFDYPQLVASSGSAEFQGKHFPKTGEFWSDSHISATRLSPDQAWLVLQSRTSPSGGKVFFDVFNVGTGSKLVTLEGPQHGAWPDELINRTGWLAGHYFVIPTGDDFERSVVCEFDRGAK